MSNGEIEKGHESIVQVIPDRGEILVSNTKDIG
jgi:hypothetical protein